MQCEVMHQTFDSFYLIVKKWSKLGQKTDFHIIFRGFPFTPSDALRVAPQFFAKWKVSWRYIIVASFNGVAFVAAKLKMFKCFGSRKNYLCRLLLLNFPKCGEILLKFGTVIQSYITHHIYYGFWYSPENFKNLIQKAHFVVGFQKFFDHTLFHPMDNAPIFRQMKGLIEIHNPGRFYCYSICGCQVIYFQSSRSSKKWYVGCFWVVFLGLQPRIKSDLYKIFTSNAVEINVSHIIWFLI